MSDPILESWSIRVRVDGGYTAPELLELVLAGKVYGHPRFAEGHKIRTSVLQELDVPGGCARTRSRRYRLGAVDPEYIAWLQSAGYSVEWLRQFRSKGEAE